jgi:cobalt-zinc-cadmium efflux system membrane fusion protein
MLSNLSAASVARITALLAALAFGMTACSGKSGPKSDPSATAGGPGSARTSAFTLTEEQQARIHTEPVVSSVFHPTIITTGTAAFNGDRSTPVLSQISGPVTRIFVDVGAQVTDGTPLASVASPDFAQAVADYQKAQTALLNTARIATLDEQLYKADAIARSDLDQAKADSASAAADREAAIQQMVALGVDSSTIDAIREGHHVTTVPGIIRSPIAGEVVEKLINPGQLIQGGQTQCFTVADLASMWVFANVFESELAGVAKGDVAKITTEASPDTLVGRVDYIAALVDTATRATSVRIVIENRHQILKRDMYVRVAIQSRASRTGLLIPVSSVLRDEENLPFVFVAAPDRGYNRRQITLGQRVGDRYEAKSGLNTSERVVSEGGLFLQFAESQ